MLFYLDPSLPIVRSYPAGVSGLYHFVEYDELFLSHVNASLIGSSGDEIFDSGNVEIYTSNTGS